ncbi:MAG: serine/threonine-protein kinase [Gemmatimonadales bacterium]
MLNAERFRKIDAIFDAALDLPEGERTRYVDQACEGDDTLRDQVVALLAGVQTAERALGEHVGDFASPVVAGLTGDDDPPLAEGARLGPWRILREVGRGGMGAVYLAERADGEFELQVAIKVIKRGRDTSEVLRRFRDERRILASLEHPNVARLLDAGSAEDGRPYLVMEYVDGRPITAWCAEQQLDTRARVALLRDVCGAVHEAHRRLIVHRDLKPSNVLVTESGSAKLLDFGIAKLLDQNSEDTGPETRLLTPDYAAPEQRAGLPVTTATDVFGLGLLMHQVLTGERPSRDRPVEQSIAGDLGTIVRRALAEEPARRYGSALQLGEDLDRWLDGLPVLARGDGVAYRIGKFVRRHRGAVAGAALAAVLLVALIVSLVLGERRTRAALAQAEFERDTAEEVARLLEGIFSSSNPTEGGRERLDTLRVAALLDRSVRQVQAGLAERPAVQARMLRALGDAYRGMGLFDAAEPLLADAVAAHRGLTDTMALANTLNSLALLELNRGRPAEAEPPLREALELYRSAAPESQGYGRALANLAAALATLAKFEEAGSLYDEAMTALERAPAPDSGLLSSVLNGKIALAGRLGDFATMATLAEQNLEIDVARHGPVHFRIGIDYGNLAFMRARLGELDAADTLYGQAVDVFRQTVGPNHPAYYKALGAHGNLEWRMGRGAEAKAKLQASVDGLRASGADADLSVSLSQLADAFAEQDSLVTAERLALEALEIERRVDGPEHPSYAATLAQLATIRCRMGRIAEGEAGHREALALLDGVLAADHPRVLDVQRRLEMCGGATPP